jgi:hypothetical protein
LSLLWVFLRRTYDDAENEEDEEDDDEEQEEPSVIREPEE